MEELRNSNKILILKGGKIALCSLLASSKNGFDKVSRLCSYSIAFEFVKTYKDPKTADEDFMFMTDENASVCFGDVGNERNLRLCDSWTGRNILLPMN